MAETIIDAYGDAGYSSATGWTQFTGQGINSDLEYRTSGSGTNKATWNFGAVPAGDYTVSVHWATHSNRATDAPYTVYHKGVNTLPSVSNPIVAVADNTEFDRDWETV